MAPIAGKYNLETSENFEEFMKQLGVGIMLRKLGASAKPSLEISEENGVWTIKTISTMKTTEVKFKLGEEITENTVDGRQCKTVFTLDGNIMTQIQKPAKDGKEVKYVREFTDTHANTTCEVEGVICKRNYKRV